MLIYNFTDYSFLANIRNVLNEQILFKDLKTKN